MRNVVRFVSCIAWACATIASYAACGGDDATGTTSPGDAGLADGGPRGVEQAGQACATAKQCYPDKAAEDAGEAGAQLSIEGITCLDRVPSGYCTHTCNDDSDCCKVPGECRTGIKQVCAPFTNDSATKYCFLSCEEEDVQAGVAANAGAGGYDGGASDAGVDDAYCQSYASTYATCRSTGGGAQNRKACIPQQ